MKPNLIVAALLALSTPAAYCVDYFLKIDGIDGESNDPRRLSTIEVLSWSWGETNASSVGSGGGGGTGKVSMQEFHFTCRLDKSSPLLMRACAQGQHISRATLYIRKPTTVAVPHRSIW